MAADLAPEEMVEDALSRSFSIAQFNEDSEIRFNTTPLEARWVADIKIGSAVIGRHLLCSLASESMGKPFKITKGATMHFPEHSYGTLRFAKGYTPGKGKISKSLKVRLAKDYVALQKSLNLMGDA